jgi:CRISPR-associated protein Cmr6
MEYSKTKAIRPVCKDVNAAIGPLPNGAFNFGLYFQKWFYVIPQTWKCPTDTPTQKGFTGLSLTDNMETSLKLYNKESILINNTKGKWEYFQAQESLKQKHEVLEKAVGAFGKLGYECLRYEVTLLTPLIIGLGNEHPTEKGFRFEWSLGIPFIPASSIKGVARLAMLVNELNQFPNLEDIEARAFLEAVKKEKWSENIRKIFGSGGEKEALRGKVIFLDAYPATLPRLKAEIMNCHYPEYFRGERGPTEDQQPNPQKYWAIDPYLDDKGTPLSFIFRLLLHREIAESDEHRNTLQEALKAALEEHGLGAKTAIGHGHFFLKRSQDEEVSSQSTVMAGKEIRRNEEKPKLPSRVETLIAKLKGIKPQDAGQIGTIIQELEKLPGEDEKSKLAAAIRDHLGTHFKKHKKRDLIESFLKAQENKDAR